MFTGIVEEIGKIQKVYKDSTSYKLSITCQRILDDVSLGDSIAVNGICLTVSSLHSNGFVADVMPETLHKTNLSKLSFNNKINLERAMNMQRRFGGHIVSGHIDGVGEIVSTHKDTNAIWLSITSSQEILRYIIYKGSVCIDGTSLTVAEVNDDTFKVSLIPHTANNTILGNKNVGDTVNIECDIIGKFVEKFVSVKSSENSPSTGLTLEFLKDNGF